MSKFHTASLPDVQSTTHIIGLLGANNYFYEDEAKFACDPGLDGWMVSDFAMLNYLFHGLGSTQRWFTCLDIAGITKQYGEYAHGNCYRSRRVVLDAHQQPDPATLSIESPTNLLPKFLDYFRSECASALAKNEPILLCVFAHGEEMEFGVEIGGEEEEGPLLTTKAVSEILSEFDGVQVTLLMTSCYSGGWAITPDLRDETGRSRITVMTAAGSDQVSESWPKTTTLGRTDGSMYVSSVINVLSTRAAQTSEGLLEKPMNTEEFSAVITSELLDVIDPRFGHIHHHAFNVQYDQWADLYTERTGIPLSHYAVRLNALREIPPRALNDIRLDRSSTTEEIDAWEAAHPTATHVVIAASNYGGSQRAVRKAISIQAKIYMKGLPGRDSLAPNHRPHRLINECIHAPHLLNEATWQTIWEILHYRIGSMNLAEKFVRRLGISAPKACRWDQDEWMGKNAKSDVGETASVFRRAVLDTGLIPPAPNSRHRYDKALWYIAVMCAESGLPRNEAQARLTKAKKSKSFNYRLYYCCAKL